MRDEWKIDAIKIGYDRALAGYWVDEMTTNGFAMETVAHELYTWNLPIREIGAALEAKQVNYNGNPILLRTSGGLTDPFPFLMCGVFT